MGVGRLEKITDFVENFITARTGGTLALLSSGRRVVFPEAVKGLLLRFAFPHDGNVMFGFDVIVELIFVLGKVPNVFDCETLQGDTVFTG